MIGLAVAQGCRVGPEPVTVDDPRVKALLSAMERVDRAAIGFTPINEDAKITLEGKRRAYDAMLHVYGNTSRTIAFRKTPVGYRWISEQETHWGPGWERTVDGTSRESITITYETEPVHRIPTNQLYIRYSGPDSTLTWPRELTLAEVRPMLEAWKTAPVEPQPPDLPDGGFGPGMYFFALVMLLIFLLACLLALLLGALATLLIAALLTAGIISASVLTGILRRSVSSGFRALFLQVGAVIGVIAGGIGALVFIWLAKLPAASPQPWIICPLVGFASGLLVACLFNFAWGRSVDWIASKLTGRKSEVPAPARP